MKDLIQLLQNIKLNATLTEENYDSDSDEFIDEEGLRNLLNHIEFLASEAIELVKTKE